MAPPASKRRKTDHQSSEDEDESASFASFHAEESEDGGNVDVPSSVEESKFGNGSREDEEIEGDSDDVEEDDYDDDEEEEDFGHDSEEKQSAPVNGAKAPRPDHKPRSKQLSGSTPAAFSAGAFKSNVFRLQVEELLAQVRPKRTNTEVTAEEALHQLKHAIEKIPSHESRAIDDAQRYLLKDKISIPFPNPGPPKDAKYKLAYSPPANINVVGSHALKTSPRTKDGIELDMTVTMPSSLFQDKDYLDYRYFYRRSYYLACLTAGLKRAFRTSFSFEYVDWHDDPLKPIIVVRPMSDASATIEKPSARWRINIIPCVDEAVFSKDKLFVNKCSIRSRDKRISLSNDEEANRKATPGYNSALRADMLTTSYLKLLHSTSKECNAFQDACMLGGTWLRQRSFGSSAHAGGFGNFEWCAVMAVMLQGGAAGGKPILSPGYSSYQLFKATMQVLAVKDLSKQPLASRLDHDEILPLENGMPVLWDSAMAHNILYKMTPWSYRTLRQEARATLSMLGEQNFDAFDACFIIRADNASYRFDHLIDLGPRYSQLLSPDSDEDAQLNLRRLYSILQRALGDRVAFINVIQGAKRKWSISSSRPKLTGNVKIGLVVNPDNVNRTIDHGPSAEDKAAAASFREFWGEKAELRRFKDGSILESLVWSANDIGQTVLEQIIRYMLNKYFTFLSSKGEINFQDKGLQTMLPHLRDIAPFRSFMDSYKELENDIRSLDDLPLSLRSIMPADPQMRYTSIHPPMTKRKSMPANVILQFEGSSRWPDNLVAVQRTKTAFLLNLSDSLLRSGKDVTARVGLENGESEFLNQSFLDVIYPTGAAFRIRIHHEREQNFLERQLKDKAIEPRTREAAATALAKFKRDYLRSPAHTQAIARLCGRFAALSGTIRLMKKWIASHLLEKHISGEVIELLAAQTFLQPWPWQTPSSVQTGFLRTLLRLSRWDWRADPLIVDLSGSLELKQMEWESINTKFEAWRKLDPALNRVVLFAASNVDQDGTTWTDGRPLRVVAARMTALARAAVAEIDSKSTALQPQSLFASPLADFDFAIHLNPALTSSSKRSKKHGTNGTTFKNLEIDHVVEDPSLVGYDAVHDFLDELTNTYGSAVLFFSGGHERPVLAGLWHPHTAPRKWRLNLAWSTVPRAPVAGQDEAQAELNKMSILGEISRLGGDLVARIEIKDR